MEVFLQETGSLRHAKEIEKAGEMVRQLLNLNSGYSFKPIRILSAGIDPENLFLKNNAAFGFWSDFVIFQSIVHPDSSTPVKVIFCHLESRSYYHRAFVEDKKLDTYLDFCKQGILKIKSIFSSFIEISEKNLYYLDMRKIIRAEESSTDSPSTIWFRNFLKGNGFIIL